MMTTTITGTVTDGRKIGRRIGFPTANLTAELPTELRDGVYAAIARFSGKSHGAVVNVGCNPSVSGGGNRRAEVHLLDFEGDIYGLSLEIELLFFIRDERRFSSLEELAAQISRDKAEAERLLSTLAHNDNNDETK